MEKKNMNLKNCKACNEPIAKGVKKCVHCGKDQRNFFMKHKIITGLSVIIVLGVIGSSGNKSTTPTIVTPATATTATSGAKVSSVSTTPVVEVQKTFKIGDVVALGNINLTVSKIVRSNGSEYEKPKAGNEFVIIYVKIKNIDKGTVSYNPFYFKLQNSKGQVTDTAITIINTDTALSSGDLITNGEIEGSVVFEAPKGDKGLILRYEDNIFTSDSKISINLK
jgi:hypothetical protein